MDTTGGVVPFHSPRRVGARCCPQAIHSFFHSDPQSPHRCATTAVVGRFAHELCPSGPWQERSRRFPTPIVHRGGQRSRPPRSPAFVTGRRRGRDDARARFPAAHRRDLLAHVTDGARLRRRVGSIHARGCGVPRRRTGTTPDPDGSRRAAPRRASPRPGPGDNEQDRQPRRSDGGAARRPPTETRPLPGTPSSTAPAATRSPRAPRQRRAPLLLQQRMQDVDLELQLADLPLRVRQPPIGFRRRPRLQPLTARRQELLPPPGDPPGRLSRLPRSSDSPRSSRSTTCSFRRALQRTSRLASGSPLAAPERDPDPSIPASRTSDIVTSSV